MPARIVGRDGLRVAQNLEPGDVLVHRLLHDLVFAVFVLLRNVDLLGEYKGVLGDACHRGGDVYARKRGAPLEGAGANGGHAVGYHNLGEGGVALERLVGNAGQNNAVEPVGKHKLGRSALIARENSLLVSIENIGVGVLPHLGLLGRGIGDGRGRGCIGVGSRGQIDRASGLSARRLDAHKRRGRTLRRGVGQRLARIAGCK